VYKQDSIQLHNVCMKEVEHTHNLDHYTMSKHTRTYTLHNHTYTVYTRMQSQFMGVGPFELRGLGYFELRGLAISS